MEVYVVLIIHNGKSNCHENWSSVEAVYVKKDDAQAVVKKFNDESEWDFAEVVEVKLIK